MFPTAAIKSTYENVVIIGTSQLLNIKWPNDAVIVLLQSGDRNSAECILNWTRLRRTCKLLIGR